MQLQVKISPPQNYVLQASFEVEMVMIGGSDQYGNRVKYYM